ncbi:MULTISPECIES: glycosyltransferase family protein [unclassified Nesterenkonia]|uniref:glycosyltransferase family protein n=1 Tax=unclassified Nesterenkonia TaxID=2629769 RepID=UPI001F4CC937|nr:MULTISPECIES: glycosyltransferase [unclassified Nesterenkonia]MCH8559800.1 glycosyl transferase [Nesterenkonia sp. DZ6]MCH8561964.1 glycosyl transferase [Nesterenkonia sp. YGD6]
MSITAVLYSHDSVGLGHARRNRALAHALAADLPRLTDQPVRGLLIAGHPDATADSLPQGWDWLVLPGFTRTAEGYASRNLDVSNERLSSLRRSTAAAAIKALSPDLFIADRHPFGVDGELLDSLAWLRAQGTRCVLGMREVLDSPAAARTEWARIGGASAAAKFYHAVWVYGDPLIYNPITSGEIPQPLATRTRFTGYLSHGRPTDELSDSSVRAREPYVLSMVGGGSDGGRLALAAAQARVPAGHRHIILTGPQMPLGDHTSVERAVAASPDSANIQVTRLAPHVPALVREAAAVVSMAGYNSTAEIMATTTPALLVPRATHRAEQPRRARALAAVGAVDTLAAGELSAAALSRWLGDAVTRRSDRGAVDLDGLTRIGALAVAELALGPAAVRRAAAGHTQQPAPVTSPASAAAAARAHAPSPAPCAATPLTPQTAEARSDSHVR